jgi:hypothetical protein
MRNEDDRYVVDFIVKLIEPGDREARRDLLKVKMISPVVFMIAEACIVP